MKLATPSNTLTYLDYPDEIVSNETRCVLEQLRLPDAPIEDQQHHRKYETLWGDLADKADIFAERIIDKFNKFDPKRAMHEFRGDFFSPLRDFSDTHHVYHDIILERYLQNDFQVTIRCKTGVPLLKRGADLIKLYTDQDIEPEDVTKSKWGFKFASHDTTPDPHKIMEGWPGFGRDIVPSFNNTYLALPLATMNSQFHFNTANPDNGLFTIKINEIPDPSLYRAQTVIVGNYERGSFEMEDSKGEEVLDKPFSQARLDAFTTMANELINFMDERRPFFHQSDRLSLNGWFKAHPQPSLKKDPSSN